VAAAENSGLEDAEGCYRGLGGERGEGIDKDSRIGGREKSSE
jgi:hypothetical protein